MTQIVPILVLTCQKSDFKVSICNYSPNPYDPNCYNLFKQVRCGVRSAAQPQRGRATGGRRKRKRKRKRQRQRKRKRKRRTGAVAAGSASAAVRFVGFVAGRNGFGFGRRQQQRRRPLASPTPRNALPQQPLGQSNRPSPRWNFNDFAILFFANFQHFQRFWTNF